MSEQDRRIAEAIEREQGRLRNFIRKRVPDREDVEDVLQDVFFEMAWATRKPFERGGRVGQNRVDADAQLVGTLLRVRPRPRLMAMTPNSGVFGDTARTSQISSSSAVTIAPAAVSRWPDATSTTSVRTRSGPSHRRAARCCLTLRAHSRTAPRCVA